MNLALNKVGGRAQKNFNARNKVLRMMETFDLIDIWRERYPSVKLYTWHLNIDTSIHCRLDYFITSSHLKSAVSDVSIIPLFASDHSCVTLKVLIGTPRGNGI